MASDAATLCRCSRHRTGHVRSRRRSSPIELCRAVRMATWHKAWGAWEVRKERTADAMRFLHQHYHHILVADVVDVYQTLNSILPHHIHPVQAACAAFTSLAGSIPICCGLCVRGFCCSIEHRPGTENPSPPPSPNAHTWRAQTVHLGMIDRFRE